MRGPTRLRLGNHNYRVKYGHIEAEGRFLFGRTQTRTTLIEIDDKVSLSQMQDTMLHEVLHAIASDTPLSWSEDTEEGTIRALTPGILAALRNNPALVKFLVEKES